MGKETPLIVKMANKKIRLTAIPFLRIECLNNKTAYQESWSIEVNSPLSMSSMI